MIGRMIGCILIVGGSAVGAGMLALPVVTGLAGFIPSLFMVALIALFMMTSALLIVEVNSWFPGRRAHFSTMVEELLGVPGKIACWILYFVLFYALLVAYVAVSGYHMASLTHLPNWMGSTIYVIVFGLIVYFSGTKGVDHANRVLMAGKILAYLGLIGFGLMHVQPALLTEMRPVYLLASVPVLVTSFGFHNMIPTFFHYLEDDKKKVRITVIGGMFFAFIIYVVWMYVAIGSLSFKELLEGRRLGIDAAQLMKDHEFNPIIGSFAAAMAFFAVLTSFLIQTLSLVHFLSDACKIPHTGKREHPLMCLFTLAPPLLLALLFPTIFYAVLDFAGGICVILLFGFLPVFMAYRGGYKKPLPLIFVFLASCGILGYQLFQML